MFDEIKAQVLVGWRRGSSPADEKFATARCQALGSTSMDTRTELGESPLRDPYYISIDETLPNRRYNRTLFLALELIRAHDYLDALTL